MKLYFHFTNLQNYWFSLKNKFQWMSNRKNGQALVEYLIILGLMAIIGVKMVKGLSKFMASSMGNLAHVVQVQLTVGVCQQYCWFQGYANGFEN